MESVLGNICDTCVRVLPNITFLWFGLSDKKFDHGGFSCAILSDTGDTRTQRDLDSNVKKGRHGVSGVGKGTFSHLHESLTLGLDTFNRSWRRERHLHLRFLQRKEGASRRVDLNELIKVTLETSQLQVVELEDVGTAIVKQSGVVTNHDACNIWEGVQVCFYPRNIDNIQVISRFIQKKNISILKHSSGQCKLHAPSTTKGGHSVVRLGLTIFGETDSSENIANLGNFKTHGSDRRIDSDVVYARQM
mmetsp:Transcript_13611/g.28535  ORF Transcript_13611/g.28535 Transcript_13611/m.28535 type:complete len:248 (+) Transcript_13611:1020-1763(+)